MIPETKKEAQTRLNRVAGQVGGIQRMIEEDKYCVDVLTQIAAVRAALDKVGLLVLKSHMKTCVADAVRGGRTEEVVEEIDQVLLKFI